MSFVVRGVERIGTLHLPSGTSRGAALVLHGFGGNPDQPHVVETCDALAGAGVAAYRFPYRDHQPPAMTYRSALEDAEHAAKMLRAHREVDASKLGVVGFSFGGAIAALLAGRDRSVRAVVIAAGIAQPQDDLDPVAAIATTRARALLLWGTRDDQVPIENAHAYQRTIASANVPCRLALIEGADHDFGPPPKRAQMTRQVAAWVAPSL